MSTHRFPALPGLSDCLILGFRPKDLWTKVVPFDLLAEVEYTVTGLGGRPAIDRGLLELSLNSVITFTEAQVEDVCSITAQACMLLSELIGVTDGPCHDLAHRRPVTPRELAVERPLPKKPQPSLNVSSRNAEVVRTVVARCL
jgi:hypothetical protein